MLGPLTPEETAFRDEVRAFLAAELTPELREAGRRCSGIFTEYPAGNDWHRILAKKGWSVPQWPVAHGGCDWSPVQHYLFAAELAAASAPPRAPMGPGMVAPVIIAFGTPEQQQRWLPGIREGRDYWCQGYSEPGSGSDLASLQCKAVRDGDHYVINGTKIWTTHAQHANRMFCLVRTQSGGKPQAGISFLCFDMDTPGITVRPIHSLSGDHELNQVFFDGVRVPLSARIGDENQGWTIAKYLLQHERGGFYTPALRSRWRRLQQAQQAAFAGEHGERSGGDEHLDLRLGLAEAHCRLDALQALELRTLRAQAAGADKGIAPSMGKLLGTELKQQLTELHLQIAGPASLVRAPLDEAAAHPLALDEDALFAMSAYLNDRAASIYAGTNEVQRNIVAAHLLQGASDAHDVLPPGAASLLGDEAAALRDSLARWLADHIDLQQHARADAPPAAPVWRALAQDLGLLGAHLPEAQWSELGGLAAGLPQAAATQALLLQTLGAWLAAEPYAGAAVVAGGVLQRAGTPAARALLAQLVDGAALPVWAHAEPGHRGDPLSAAADVAATLIPEAGRGWRLHGRKTAVIAAPQATHLVVSARRSGRPGDAEGLDLLLLPIDAPGLSRRDLRTLDGGSCSELQFDGVAVPPEALLTAPGQAHGAIHRALDEATLAACCEALGVLRRLQTDTLAHVRERRQFGQPLAAFQVLQHHLADMHIARELAEALTWSGVALLADGQASDSERALAVSSAKVAVGRACRCVGQGAVQLHGAMGVTEELAVGRFFRRATQLELAAGSTQQHLRRIATLQALRS